MMNDSLTNLEPRLPNKRGTSMATATHLPMRLFALLVLLVSLCVVSGCGGSSSGSSASGASTGSDPLPSPAILAIRDDTDQFLILKQLAQAVGVDFSETATGISLAQQVAVNCPAGFAACEDWPVSASPTATAGTYDIPIGYLDVMAPNGIDEIPAGDFPRVSVIPRGPGSAAVVEIASGFDFSLALTTDGEVWSWGVHNGDQLGRDISGTAVALGEPTAQTVPRLISSLSGVVNIAAGGRHSLAVLADGRVLGWGNNLSGQISDSPSLSIATPTDVPGLGAATVVAAAAGRGHSLGLLSDGTVMAWGSNSDGQLGIPGAPDNSLPQLIPGLSNVQAISAGGDHSLALLNNGSVMAWGRAGSTSGSSQEPAPVTVPNLANAQAISVSFNGGHALALLSDGTVRAWGDNTFGELGTGDQISSPTPQPVVGLAFVTAISAGFDHSLAILADGTAMAWGANLRFADNSNTPISIPGIQGAQAVTSSRRVRSLIIDSACSGGGRLWSLADPTSITIQQTVSANGTGGFPANSSGRMPELDHHIPVLTMGDAANCSTSRVIIFVTGEGNGTIISDAGPVNCAEGIDSPDDAPATATGYCWIETVNASITFTATPDPDSTFEGWRWDCASSGATTTASLSPAGDSETLCKVVFDRVGPSVAICNDGLDNDGDGLIDLNDPGCADVNDNDETDPPPTGSFTLSLTIFGGPGAGMVDSSDSIPPTFSCINSSEPQTTCTATFPAGTQVNLIPSAFIFPASVTWTGCDVDIGIEGCEVLMNQNRTVEITFF